MAVLFPRYGRSRACDVLIERPQVQPAHMRDGLNRLVSYKPRPVGYRAPEVTVQGPPETFFVLGAPFISTVGERVDAEVIPSGQDVL